MSLDVYLELDGASAPKGSGIYVRENGQTKEISQEEWNERFPGREPVVFCHDDDPGYVYHGNITHNLGTMANAAGIYKYLWEPETLGIEQAKQLIGPLANAYATLSRYPDKWKMYNPPNGWGSYEVLLTFVTSYLAACKNFPDATIRISR